MTTTQAVRAVDLVRMEDGAAEVRRDLVAVERALEVRLNGAPFSVIMRTPGEDRALAIGFLFSEGVVRGAADVVDVDEAGDVVDVRLSPERTPILEQLLGGRRNVAMNSSCGMCGRRTLESLDVDIDPLPSSWRVPASLVSGLPAALATEQHAFAGTGGLHAAALFDRHGRLDRSAEDVGRHNAVDKLVGHMVLARRVPLNDYMLMVSGRLSFELVQKAWLAGVPLIAAVSAPSSLAIDLAARAGMTVVAFVRDGRFNVYAGAERIG